MKTIRQPERLLVAAVTILLFTAATASAQKLQYPQTKKVDHVDTYHGVQVPDPYRWLEDENSADTRSWVEAQNKVTFGYLEKMPFRKELRERLERLSDYPKYSTLFHRGEYYFFYKNEGLQNQSVLYVQKGIDGPPEVLLDPNSFSADGTTRLSSFSPSKDAQFAVFGKSTGGSDWQELYVLELATKKPLPDTLKWTKFSSLSWRGHGFYYSRFEAPEKGKELTAQNVNQKVYFHKVGTPQSADELVYEDKSNPLRFSYVGTTSDQRFAYLSTSEPSKGKRGNALFVRDLAKNEKSFKALIATIGDDSYNIIDNLGDKLLVRTNKNAPNGRVVLIDPKKPEEKNWKDVLPEKADPLQGVSTVGGKLFASYLKDVTTRVYVCDYEGKLENEVELPDLGVAGGFGGEKEDTLTFYTFNSFNFPPAIYRYDIASRKSTVFRAPQIPEYNPSDYETKQVFFKSKDGTSVPMFIVHKKGMKNDGTNPTLLYGYGGFNISTTPSFSATRVALLEQGFIYASVNMRGGGEYGEKWHEAGTKLRKQNVFDDFIAAAEYLIADKYTAPEKIAIQGASNGGLLVGAVINQRPELFKVAIPQVGVMDMLRFHKFTVGAGWISDYGSSDNEEEFKALYRYSPLHNIREGLSYPATLITTADHDDRVVPAHSFKYAATLQEKYHGENPVLIRIDTRSGHGASSTTKALDLSADIYAFIMFNLGAKAKIR